MEGDTQDPGGDRRQSEGAAGADQPGGECRKVHIARARVDPGGLSEHWTGRALLRVTVEDTGIGIPEDAQKQMFKKFNQADTSITRRFGGTGLGLAIRKELVQLMGGQLGVRSAPGDGSTFWFTLSLPTQNAAHASTATIPVLAGIRVLAAEAQPLNRRILEETLTQLEGSPYNGGIAGRDAQGAGSLTPEPFHILLVDHRLSGRGKTS